MIQVVAQEVKTIQLEVHCESCGEQVIRYGKARMMKGRLMFPHPCGKCQVTYMIGEEFPKRYSGKWEEVERINLLLRDAIKVDPAGELCGVEVGHVVEQHFKREEQLEIRMD